MSTRTEVCNLAISHLAIGEPISNWETDASKEAEALRRFYKPCRDTMLRDIDWSFAKKYAQLSLVEADPVTEWAYSYQYPSDCLFLRKVRGAARTDTDETKVAYERVGQYIYCDESPCNVKYTERLADDSELPEDFAVAFALRLALEVAPRVIGGDLAAITKRLNELYVFELANAKQNDANEAGWEKPQDGDYLSSRN